MYVCTYILQAAEETRDGHDPTSSRPSSSVRCTLPNRVVMAPMTRNRAGPGNVPGALAAEYYAQRAAPG